jgi:hypothetical protein
MSIVMVPEPGAPGSEVKVGSLWLSLNEDRRAFLYDFEIHARQRLVVGDDGLQRGALGLGRIVHGSLLARLTASLGAEGVVAQVRGDPVEPARQVVLALRRERLLIQLQEDLLGDVLRLLAAADEPEEDAVDGDPVSREDGVEGVGVATTDALQEDAVRVL